MASTNTSSPQISADWLSDYAQLLTAYCLDLQPKEKLFVRSSDLALPLLKEIFAAASARGAHCQFDIQFAGQNRMFYQHATSELLADVHPIQKHVIDTFDAYLVIRAPHNLYEDQGMDPAKTRLRSEAHREINAKYMQRTASLDLKRSLCQFPTYSGAQLAGMSLTSYTDFIRKACKLDQDNPMLAWQALGRNQQAVVDYLNQVSQMRYVGPGTDISFSVAGRTWINSDGRTNMPSGEVYSAPVEDSVQGHVSFSYPSSYLGQTVYGIQLWVENGVVVKWAAEQGQAVLDAVFAMPGANRFGEVAIGMNYEIQQATHNILFDEKIGGSIHMAVGQSYPQCGGKNTSPIHWDMITDMKNGGEIYADDNLIYKNGAFLFGA